MKTKTIVQKLLLAMKPISSRLSQFIVLGGIILIVGCMSSELTPVSGVPLTVESRSIYQVQHTFVYYRNGTLFVEAQLTLASGIILPSNTYFDVKAFDTSGKMVGETDARLERNEKTFRGDRQLNASFKASIQVPLDQVARIEAQSNLH